MEQSINLGFVQLQRNNTEKRSLENAVKLCRDAGFSRFDYLSGSLEDAYKDKEFFDSRSVKVIQSHCPFFRYKEDGLNKFKSAAPQAVKIAAVLGAEFFVVHADENRMNDDVTFREMLKITREYLAPIVDLCGEYGMKLAVENLFEESAASSRSRFCSEPEEVIAVIESFPGTGIGCCWDSGHHNVAFGKEDFFEKMEMLAPYIICTHMHDNHFGRDMHKPAFFGNIGWEKVMETLRKHHYAGDISWEFVYERIPDALLGEYLKFIHSSGCFLLKNAPADITV